MLPICCQKHTLNPHKIRTDFLCAGYTQALAYFELLYAQTHYTYQFVSTDNTHSLNGYHLTQTYLGEAANSADGSTQYRFYGERNISREENRWLFAISILLLITALIVTAVGALKKPTRMHW